MLPASQWIPAEQEAGEAWLTPKAIATTKPKREQSQISNRAVENAGFIMEVNNREPKIIILHLIRWG